MEIKQQGRMDNGTRLVLKDSGTINAYVWINGEERIAWRDYPSFEDGKRAFAMLVLGLTDLFKCGFKVAHFGVRTLLPSML